tara:strand:+ start:256 stop:666 length:411 start_codon:yes stop_codon:yes gene_type:complete
MPNEIVLTTELKTAIVKQLMEGKPLTKICQDKQMPSLSKVYDLIAKHKDFALDVASARRHGCQTYLDKMIEELEAADNKNIMVIREKLHHYRWMASKLLPNLYGDKQQVEVDSKVEITWNTNTATNTIEAKVLNDG